MKKAVFCPVLAASSAVFFIFAGFPVVSGVQAQSRAAAAKEAAFLKRLAGNWTGRGRLKRTFRANLEPVSCRLAIKPAGNGISLTMAYNCLGLDLRFGAQGTLTYRAGDRRYAGAWYVTGRAQSARGIGVRRGSGLSFTLTGTNPDTGKPVTSRLSVRLSGRNRLINTMTSQDPQTGKTFRLLNMTFTR
jgi:hypothetical protein